MEYKYFTNEELVQLESSWRAALVQGPSTWDGLKYVEDRLRAIKDERASRMGIQDASETENVDSSSQDLSASAPF
jgi:hypothetical protein